MTRFIIDARGSWSGGGRAFLANAHYAARRHPNLLALGDPNGSQATPVVPRNLPTKMSALRRPFLLIPQNAWAWHGPTHGPRSYTRRAGLRAGAEVSMKAAQGIIRIGPMVPARAKSHPTFLPNVLDEQFEGALEKSYEVKIEYPTDYILGLGSLNAYRNMETLIEAHQLYIRRGGHRSLHILGAGDATYRKYLGQPPGVTFHGAVSRADTLAWMRNSALTVLPSLVEASPVTVLEAQVVGSPLAVSRIAGHTYMLDEGLLHSTFSPLDTHVLSKLLAEEHSRPVAPISDANHRQQRREWWSDLLAQQLTDLSDNNDTGP